MKMRTKKEIEDKIAKIYDLIKRNKINGVYGIVATDILAWVLGEDYLDNLEVYNDKTDNETENAS